MLRAYDRLLTRVDNIKTVVKQPVVVWCLEAPPFIEFIIIWQVCVYVCSLFLLYNVSIVAAWRKRRLNRLSRIEQINKNFGDLLMLK